MGPIRYVDELSYRETLDRSTESRACDGPTPGPQIRRRRCIAGWNGPMAADGMPEGPNSGCGEVFSFESSTFGMGVGEGAGLRKSPPSR